MKDFLLYRFASQACLFGLLMPHCLEDYQDIYIKLTLELPTAMDATDCSSSQIRLMLNDSKYLGGTFVSSDGTMLSEQASCLESSPGSEKSPSLTSYLHHPTEEDVPLVRVKGNCAPSDCSSRVGEGILNTNLVSSDSVGPDGTAFYKKHEQCADSLDSETASVSKSATAGVKEISKAFSSYMDFACSDGESYGEPSLIIDELNKELMVSRPNPARLIILVTTL